MIPPYDYVALMRERAIQEQYNARWYTPALYPDKGPWAQSSAHYAYLAARNAYAEYLRALNYRNSNG